MNPTSEKTSTTERLKEEVVGANYLFSIVGLDHINLLVCVLYAKRGKPRYAGNGVWSVVITERGHGPLFNISAS